ncbi:MAG TPA: hypothetical protein PKK06_12805 [Phycisphaerae bacterium]|nr:hypothetical protein [Phycisphaerae bacterium]HNU45515.1 hypothetical protein [Phycisphaerae bacterium]
MVRSVSRAVWAALVLVAPVAGADWQLQNVRAIAAFGTQPSLWDGKVAFLYGSGGPLMYYDGFEVVTVYGAEQYNYEPATANGYVAWRNRRSRAWVNDIYRWNGQTVVNISNGADVSDCTPSLGRNGDILWSRNYTQLMYYNNATGQVTSLGVSGQLPSLFIRPNGTKTYAYQDPSTYEVKYYDGTVTHTLAVGASMGAFPSLWDGAVAWMGEGPGGLFVNTEIFYWKNGVTTRLTNDPAPGIGDANPRVWQDMVVWGRMTAGPLQPHRLYFWDGQLVRALRTTGGNYPSFHDRQIAWVENDGIYLGDLVLPGDLDDDGDVDTDDYIVLAGCLAGPLEIGPADFDDDADVDWDDLAAWLGCFHGPGVVATGPCSAKDLDGDTDVDLRDYARFVAFYERSPEEPLPAECRVADRDADGDVDFRDFARWELLLQP